MKTRTEELLYFLLWSVDTLTRPTFRNVTESFESWAYRNGLLRELARLEKRKLLERGGGLERIYRLTDGGRVHALGGRDPEERWSRPWDNCWRLVCFDVPTTENSQRLKLTRYLRGKQFGYLQNSVWVTPDRLDQEIELLGQIKSNVESLVLFEAKTCGCESSADIVSGAWDFAEINQRYSEYLHVLNAKPRRRRGNKIAAMELRSWAEAERGAWRNVMAIDPLLPGVLLPRGYLGRKAWQSRVKVLRAARRDLEHINLPREVPIK